MTERRMPLHSPHRLLAALLLFACGADKGTSTGEGTSSAGPTTGEVPTGTGAADTTGEVPTGTGAGPTTGEVPTGTGAADTTGEVSTGTGAAETGGLACSPGPNCVAVARNCIGLVDNADRSDFGLRISQLDVAKPGALSSGIVAGLVANAVMPALPGCNLMGGGTLNWLLQFDTAASTLTIGGAKPVADPVGGYSFINEMSGTFSLAPAVYTGVAPDGDGVFSTATGASFVVPMYLDADAMGVILLPLEQARVISGTLADANNCIGDYNAEGLDPGAQCIPDDANPGFHTGAKVEAFISLEVADQVVVGVLQQTLCVLLSGDAATYGVLEGNTTVCKRTMDKEIVFRGDWCASTNMAGDAQCGDAMHFMADFAASSVLIQ